MARADLGWRADVRCGPNALYILLFMYGKKADYHILVSKVHLTERGASVADLARVAAEYDLPLIALKAQSSAVDRLPLPAIVHCQNPGTDGGHYLVLLRVNTDGTLTILEGTTGRLERWSKGDFYDQWTGVVLVRSDRWDSKRLDPLMAFSSGLGLLIAIACFMRVRRTARARDKAV
ncbi:MAG: cysteine peptidase family C39 domain-containing protein [Thermoguttaceae bacterium]